MPLTQTDVIERLMLKVEAVRKAQDEYFARGNNTNLKAAKAKETELDAYVILLRRAGYKPENQQNNTNQKTMF